MKGDEEAVKELRFEDCAHAFLQGVDASERGGSLGAKRAILERHLLPALGSTRLVDLRGEDVERYKSRLLAQEFAPKTVNNHLAVLRAVLRFTERTIGWVSSCSVTNCPPARPSARWLTDSEAAALLAAADAEHHLMLLLALRVGLRLGELRALRWSDVSLGAAALRVRGEGSDSRLRGASSRARELPLGPVVLRALKAHPCRGPHVFSTADGKPLTPGDCKWPLYRACRRAGLPLLGWQVLRNTFARQLLERNTPIQDVLALLGCRSLAPSLLPAPTLPDAQRRAIHLLDVRDRRGGARSGLLVFVPNYRGYQSSMGFPRLGAFRIPVRSLVTRRQPAHEYRPAPSDIRCSSGHRLGHDQDGALSALGHGSNVAERPAGTQVRRSGGVGAEPSFAAESWKTSASGRTARLPNR